MTHPNSLVFWGLVTGLLMIFAYLSYQGPPQKSVQEEENAKHAISTD